MRLQAVLTRTRNRLTVFHVWLVVAVLALPYLLGYVRGASRAALGSPVCWLSLLVLAVGMGMGYALTSPIPWQWTGDDRTSASWPRGLLQSLVFNGLLVLALEGASGGLLLLAGMRPLVQRSAWTDTFLNAGLTGLIMAMVGSVILGLEVSSQERAEAQAEADRARWLLLKGQLGAHVLYNTLNALAELIRQDPLAAERVVLDLSELFERISALGERVAAPLREERAILERYLSLQKLTLGDRLTIRWDWDPALDALEVPPLLLQPLVENALKHGISEHVRGGVVSIEGRGEGEGWIHLQVANGGAPLVPGRAGGVGLANLKHRLALAYGEAAEFSLEARGGETVASLRLRPCALRIRP